ncbi:hypothetical protein RJT34_18592 [Clitoria ternatea]|uniref:Uncharacterized protein n=1 Tax=Clitoria ternatea TaxID=43366 RepID=A0AAN9JCM5_CLITE
MHAIVVTQRTLTENYLKAHRRRRLTVKPISRPKPEEEETIPVLLPLTLSDLRRLLRNGDDGAGEGQDDVVRRKRKTEVDLLN